MISIEFLIALLVGGVGVVLGLLRRRQNGNDQIRVELQTATTALHEENKQLRASADFLLAQNVALSKQTDIMCDEIANLKYEVSRLRRELGDAQALLRAIPART